MIILLSWQLVIFTEVEVNLQFLGHSNHTELKQSKWPWIFNVSNLSEKSVVWVLSTASQTNLAWKKQLNVSKVEIAFN